MICNKAGYRDGITAGQQSAVQAGFDQGFSRAGAPLGRDLGFLRGIAASLLAHLTSKTSASVETQVELTEISRGLVRRLGKLRIQDLAGRDEEAEAHARQHGEEINLPKEIRDKREMQGLEAGMEGLNSLASTSVLKGQVTTQDARHELEQCRNDLRQLLGSIGLTRLQL